MDPRPYLHPADLRGIGRLATDGVAGISDLVEHLHRAILSGPVARPGTADGRTRGITGFVYRTVRGVNGIVAGALDLGFALAESRSSPRPPNRRRERFVAVLNGVLGDHLERSENPLAVRMQLRHGNDAVEWTRPLSTTITGAKNRVVVMLHGLCMTGAHWTPGDGEGADLPRALAEEADYSVLHLDYNTGRNVWRNGRDFAEMLEGLLAQWPMRVEELALVGHSMGGLVARSAVHHGLEAGHRWPARLRRMVFLGTPHLGSPLERAGNLVDRALGLSRYSAPFARLGAVRSAGITDLRHGAIVPPAANRADAQGDAAACRRGHPLPGDVRCILVAATTAEDGVRRPPALRHDGLVPVSSALGRLGKGRFAVPGLPDDRLVVHGTGHLQLLHSPEVVREVSRRLS